MIFTFNKNIGKEYNKRIKSKCVAVGSIKNNFIIKKSSNLKKKKPTVYFSL